VIGAVFGQAQPQIRYRLDEARLGEGGNCGFIRTAIAAVKCQDGVARLRRPLGAEIAQMLKSARRCVANQADNGPAARPSATLQTVRDTPHTVVSSLRVQSAARARAAAEHTPSSESCWTDTARGQAPHGHGA